MKNKIKMVIVICMLCIGIMIPHQKASAQVNVSFQVFYDDLSPYGSWVDNSDYGYVWVPDVGQGFSPYSTNGYWVFTDLGWTWVSNYSWGWAPFHYGRWFYDPYYGWVWIPDNEWAPAWVSWRSSDDYYGWAPLGPGISIDFVFGIGNNIPYNYWTFVRNSDFGRPNIYNYYVNNSNNVTIINNTTVVNNIRVDNSRNTRYNAGPNRTEVEKRAGRTFRPVTVRESSKPAQHLRNGELEIYRPRVAKNNSGDRKPSPAKITRQEDVRRNGDKRNANQQARTDAENPQQKQRDDQIQRPQQKQRNDQLQREQQQKQRNDQLQKEQQQKQRNDQLQRQQQQKQRNDQLQREQQLKQRNDQLQRQQQQKQRNEQLQRQQQQQQRNEQMQRQQQQQQRNEQMQRQQQQQQQRNEQRQQQQQQQPQQKQPPKKGKG